jgi:hypothetical protein
MRWAISEFPARAPEAFIPIDRFIIVTNLNARSRSSTAMSPRQSPSLVSAEPLWKAIWSVLALLISYCGASGLA